MNVMDQLQELFHKYDQLAHGLLHGERLIVTDVLIPDGSHHDDV